MQDNSKDYNRRRRVVIIVAAHKAFRMPDDRMYLPVHVGAEGKTDENGNPLDLGFQKDNVGDNISALNPRFCELTGVYWAWKNLNADYIGLVHYRRYFKGKKKKGSKDPFDNILRYSELKQFVNQYKVIVTTKRHYYIDTLEKHYAHNHHISELNKARDILLRMYPDYEKAYDKAIHRTWGYMFNMMIMREKIFDDYCTWLFSILFELSKEIPEDGLTPFENRFPGRVSERLFNVWLEKQIEDGTIEPSEIKEIPFIYMEHVNPLKKGVTFLKAKFLNKKPEKSC